MAKLLCQHTAVHDVINRCWWDLSAAHCIGKRAFPAVSPFIFAVRGNECRGPTPIEFIEIRVYCDDVLYKANDNQCWKLSAKWHLAALPALVISDHVASSSHNHAHHSAAIQTILLTIVPTVACVYICYALPTTDPICPSYSIAFSIC